MAKNLVIVESPAKSKTIYKILGGDYEVKASMGHICNLPKNELGVDISKDFKPKFQVIPARKKTVKELKKAAKSAEKVYLATDLDREGEAIAAHLAESLKVPDKKIYRVTFNEITPVAIKEAFKSPGKISADKVDAQKARRILDRLVGYKISPLLWSKIMSGLSAGRVQSVALRLVAERELEIRAFEPEEYWEIDADLRSKDSDDKNKEKDQFRAQLKKVDGKKPKIPNEEEATKLVENLKEQDFIVSKVEKKEKRVTPYPPFITSTLQQRASTRLYFSPKKTMMIAQQLYEGVDLPEGSVGLITYMRTDSVSVSKNAREAAKKLVEEKHGKKYLPKRTPRYKSRSGAQQAHEAIRPTAVKRHPDMMKKHLSKAQYRLYKLIWERFVASQMAPAIYDTTKVEIEAGDTLFQVKGKILKFDGYLKVYSQGRKSKKDDQLLPEIKENEKLKVDEIIPSQHFTKPPPRYTEASLVRTLEKEGIGRPSTYAVILSNIQNRNYIELNKRTINATDLGILVAERLKEHFPRIMDFKFTSRMEKKLDKIEEGKADWVKTLEQFYDTFTKELKEAELEMKGLNEDPELTDEVCEECGKKMQYLWRRDPKEGITRFLGCSGYPECKNTRSVGEDADREDPEETEYTCEKCGSPMLLRDGRNGKFLGCSSYPECKFTQAVDKEGKPLEIPEGKEECEKCGSDMAIKSGRRGPFLACTAYPKCRNAQPLNGEKKKEPKPTGLKCEKCDSDMAIKYGRRGPFVACTGYPKCKNAKPMSVLKKDDSDEGEDSKKEEKKTAAKRKGKSETKSKKGGKKKNKKKKKSKKK